MLQIDDIIFEWNFVVDEASWHYGAMTTWNVYAVDSLNINKAYAWKNGSTRTTYFLYPHDWVDGSYSVCRLGEDYEVTV